MYDIDLIAVNEREYNAYLSYRQLYDVQHPSPTQKNESDWKDSGFIFKGKIVTTIAAVLLAGFRTAEQFFLAASNQGNTALGWIEAILAVLAIEGLILFLAADNAKRRGRVHGWASWTGIVLALTVSLLAGFGQSMRLVVNLDQEILGWFTIALAFGLAFASLVAYIGGEILGQELARIDNANSKNLQVYEKELKEYEKSLQASWMRSQERKIVRDELKLSEKFQEVSETMRSIGDWRYLSEQDKLNISTMNAKQVQKIYGVEERTAYNWISKAEEFSREYVYGKSE